MRPEITLCLALNPGVDIGTLRRNGTKESAYKIYYFAGLKVFGKSLAGSTPLKTASARLNSSRRLITTTMNATKFMSIR